MQDTSGTKWRWRKRETPPIELASVHFSGFLLPHMVNPQAWTIKMTTITVIIKSSLGLSNLFFIYWLE